MRSVSELKKQKNSMPPTASGKEGHKIRTDRATHKNNTDRSRNA